jgi:hypothetical protein
VYAVEADPSTAQTAADLAGGAKDLCEQLAEARAENATLRALVEGLADRVAGQSELLSKRADREKR